jgi:hypothetical protein
MDGREPLRSCEDRLLTWLRAQAKQIAHGAVQVQLKAEVQDGVVVMIRLTGPAEIEQRFR